MTLAPPFAYYGGKTTLHRPGQPQRRAQRPPHRGPVVEPSPRLRSPVRRCGVSTRSGARVYRRAPKPMADRTCPHCQQVVTILESGRRRTHQMDGVRCTGSGIAVDGGARVTFDPDEVDAAIRASLTTRAGRANPWSGKA